MSTIKESIQAMKAFPTCAHISPPFLAGILEPLAEAMENVQSSSAEQTQRHVDIASTPSGCINEGVSYLIYNPARKLYVRVVNSYLSGTTSITKTEAGLKPYLFTFEKSGAGWYIHYTDELCWQTLVNGNDGSGTGGSNNGVGKNWSRYRLYHIGSNYFTFQIHDGNGVTLDNNGNGQRLAGWGNTEVIATGGNNSWELIPVLITDSQQEHLDFLEEDKAREQLKKTLTDYVYTT